MFSLVVLCGVYFRLRSGAIGHVPIEQSVRGVVRRLRDGGNQLGVELRLWLH
jgi:hypothetical protein